ncbi:MAG: putative ABC transport system permease protein, partial [Saprospiraceae bacterium]
WKNIISNRLSTALSLILFALGVGLISILLTLNKQVQEKFDKNLAGIDLVIGAKGSPLQLILCNMYHIDNPTGNISIKEAKAFMKPGHPLIETAIPISVGDSHKGYRIVGTTKDIVDLYEGEIAQGKMWEHSMEVTVGAAVAANLKLKLGDNFKSSHGLIEDPNLVHDDVQSLRVVGVLKPSGSVLDQLILTSTASVWDVHDHGAHEAMETDNTEDNHDHAGHDHAAHDQDSHDHDGDGKPDHAAEDHDDHVGHDHSNHDHDNDADASVEAPPLWEMEDKEITALLIKYKGRSFRTLNLARNINDNTDMQAAMPAIEINRLYSMMGVGMDALEWLARIIVFVSGLSIFISLFSSLRDRKYELALMRVMGATPGKLFVLIILEGLLLAALGYILGILLSHLSMYFLGDYMSDEYKYSFQAWSFLKEEGYLLLGALAIGFVAAVIPAIQARNTDISETLSNG